MQALGGNKLTKLFDGQPRFVSFFAIRDSSFLAVFNSLLKTWRGIFLNLFCRSGKAGRWRNVYDRKRPWSCTQA